MDNIVTLAGKFESFVDLQNYCDQQFLVITELKNEAKLLKEEIAHLKTLLTSTTTLIEQSKEPIKVEVSSEQAICEIQIEKLRTKAVERELTLEETKRLDLLVKNLYLIKFPKNQDMEAEFRNLSSLPKTKLLELAAMPEEPVE